MSVSSTVLTAAASALFLCSSAANAAPIHVAPSQQKQQLQQQPAEKKSGSGSSSTLDLFILSDLHYDPYYGTSSAYGPCTDSSFQWAGTANCDSSLKLVQSAFTDLTSEISKSTAAETFFMYTGDMLRHDLTNFGDYSKTTWAGIYQKPLAIAESIFKTVGQLMVTTFATSPGLVHTANDIAAHQAGAVPAPPAKSTSTKNLRLASIHPNLLPSLGNNDVIPHYEFNITKNTTDHPVLAQYQAIFKNLGLLSSGEASAWAQCGFFSRTITVSGSPTLLLINLNTQLWSDDNTNNNGGDISDPCGQFAWTQSQLEIAKSNSYAVYIVGHIIPQATKWQAPYLSKYFSMITQYNSVIRAQFYAHTHMLTFMAASEDDSTPPLFDLPSISPRDGNLPSYVRISLDSNWHVLALHHRYLNNQTLQWTQANTFSSEYISDLDSPITTSSLYKYADDLLDSKHKSNLWETFLAYYQGGQITDKLSKKDKKKVCCKMISTSHKAYKKCK